MPIAQIQKPSGEIISLEVPEGTTPSQALSLFSQYQNQGSNQQTQQENSVLDSIKNAIAPVIRGAGLTGAGALAGGAVGGPPGALAGAGIASLSQTVADPAVKAVNSLLGTNLQEPSKALSDLFTSLGVPESSTEAQKTVEAIAQGGSGAAGFSALGSTLMKAASPVIQGIGRALSSTPRQDIVAGSAAGGVQQALENVGASPASQALGGLAAGLAAGGISTSPKNIKVTPSDIAQAEKAGLKITTSDVLPPDTYVGKQVRRLSERIPIVGTGSIRADQAKAREELVKKTLSDFGVDNPEITNTLTEVTDNVLKTRKAFINSYQDSKKNIIDRLSGYMQQQKNIESFDQVGMPQLNKVTETVPIYPVDVSRTTDKINKTIEKLSLTNTKEDQTISKILQDWSSSLQNKDIQSIEEIRKQIGETFKSTGLESIKNRGEKILNSIYSPLDMDIRDSVKKYLGEDQALKFRAANAALKSNINELKINTLKNVLRKGDVQPEVVKTMLFNTDPSIVNTLYKNLDEKGRASARLALFQKAADLATPAGARGLEDINPDRFIKEAKDLSSTSGVFLSKEDKNVIDGLARILQVTQYAKNANVDTSTGQQLYLPTLASIAAQYFNRLPELVGAGAAIGTAARVYESKPVRNLLMKLPKVEINSLEESNIFKRLINVIQNYQEEK